MLYESEGGEIVLALTGDTLLTRRLSPFREDRFLQLREILRAADVVYTNFESSAHENGDGTPTLGEGTYMTTEPRLLDDLKWLGFNLVSAANNHAFDWGEAGILLTMQYLRQVGIPFSGIGRNLREAARPVYLETPGGRVALISANSMFNELHRATNQGPDTQGKPGINALGYRKSYVVDRESFEDLRRIGASLPLDAERKRFASFGFFAPSEVGTASESRYDFLGTTFTLGDGFEAHTTVNQRDAAENLRQVREARRQADLVVFSHHCHQLGGQSLFTATKFTELEEPAEFMVEFAHRCIDEGVDVFIGHGPHFSLGVEIYKGKPIFYSLGHFIMQNETVQVLPSYAYDRFDLDQFSTPGVFLDARSDSDRKAHPADPLYWETLLATCTFKGGALQDIRLHPVDLGFRRPRAQRGRPVLADRELGDKIIARLARMSRNLGTHIECADGRGVIANPEADDLCSRRSMEGV